MNKVKAGDKIVTYFGGPYEVVELRERVKITGIKKDRDPHRDIVVYKTPSGDLGHVLLVATRPA